jgi:hypothetical protein
MIDPGLDRATASLPTYLPNEPAFYLSTLPYKLNYYIKRLQKVLDGEGY